MVSSTTYGPSNELLQLTASTFTETSTYNANLELTELTWGANVHYKYNYSATQDNGQILSQNDVISGETITYQYDTLKRLVSANASGDPHGPWSQNFAIDGFGNLNQITGSNGPSLSVGIDYTTNRIQSSSAYDANGNMTGYSGSTYAYDVENRMTQSNPASGGTVFYGYDSTNQRVYKGLYSNNTYSGEEIYFYGAEGHKYGTWQINPATGVLLQASVTKQWFGNRLVSPQDRLDSRGKYFPFGQERTNVTPVNPPNDQEKFASYTRDSATGLDYADQRYYNNLIGRFMRPDPFGRSANPNNPQTWNRSAYVGNDPANNFDPEGLYDEGEGDYGDFSTDLSGDQGGGGSGAFAPLPSAPPMQLNAPDAANGTSNSSTYNGTALFSDTSTCPPNCGSTMANIDEMLQMINNLISPVPSNVISPAPNNPCANATLTAAGTTAQQQIATAQGFITAGQVGASATPYPNPVLSFFGGMYGYYEAVHTGGPNDIKNQPGPGYQNQVGVDAGNISFGITCPYGGGFCQFAAGAAQTLSGNPNFNGTLVTGFDTPSDNAGIRVGQAMRAAGCNE